MAARGARQTTPATWKEGRRVRAWHLHRKGWPGHLIAEALGVTPAAVSTWLAKVTEEGPESLRARSRHGQGSRLSKAQHEQLPTLLERGAESYGFVGDLWTCRRIAEVITREFGVRYHPSHVSRLLHALQWTYQKPIFRASERDEEAIARWLTHGWPAIKKKPKTRAEPSFSLMNRGSRCDPPSPRRGALQASRPCCARP